MTREEAIEKLKMVKSSCFSDEREAIDMAIEVLQAKTDGDIISRQCAIEAMKERSDELRKHLCYSLANGVGEGIEVIKSLPPTEPKTGEWIENVIRWGNKITTVHGYRCSECGELNMCKDKFCPNCGIRMRVEGNKE